MKCPNCGKEVTGDTCPYCGTKMPKQNNNNSDWVTITKEYSDTHKEDKFLDVVFRNKVWIIVSIAAFVVGMFVGTSTQTTRTVDNTQSNANSNKKTSETKTYGNNTRGTITYINDPSFDGLVTNETTQLLTGNIVVGEDIEPGNYDIKIGDWDECQFYVYKTEKAFLKDQNNDYDMHNWIDYQELYNEENAIMAFIDYPFNDGNCIRIHGTLEVTKVD